MLSASTGTPWHLESIHPQFSACPVRHPAALSRTDSLIFSGWRIRQVNSAPLFDRQLFSVAPFDHRVEKPWGYEVLLSPPGAPYTSKLIAVRAGNRLSLQVHDVKVET